MSARSSLSVLARTGFEEITVIDPDWAEERNLDRLVYADRHCLGLRKVDVAAAHLRRVATARRPVIALCPRRSAPSGPIGSPPTRTSLCAVSTTRKAREVLNHIAYSNCLPLIDGGVLVDSRERLLSAKWGVHLVGRRTCGACAAAGSTRAATRETSGWVSGAAGGISTTAGMTARNRARTRLHSAVWSPPKRCACSSAIWLARTGGTTAGATSGQWSFEHRFVEAETEWLEHPDRCVDSCEFARKRVGRGEGGRPTYPFLDEMREGWRDRFRLSCRRVRATLGRVASAFADLTTVQVGPGSRPTFGLTQQLRG